MQQYLIFVPVVILALVYISVNIKRSVCKRQMISETKTSQADELGGNGHFTRTIKVYKQQTIIAPSGLFWKNKKMDKH